MSEFRVALTFDAEHPGRPHCAPGVQERIVEVLASERVPATFFLQGRWVTAYPQLARTIARNGHLIGNHSYAHARMTRLSDGGLRDDVGEAEGRIRDVTGRDPRPWFRCPYGDGSDDQRVLDGLGSLGYRHVHWDVDSCDWCDDQTAETVMQTVVDGLRDRRDGSIVLMHTWPEPTASTLPALVRRLRALGSDFVTVAEVCDEAI